MAKQKKQEPIERATEVDAQDIGGVEINLEEETTPETKEEELSAAEQVHKVSTR